MYPVTSHWAVSAVTPNASMMSMRAMLTMFSLNATTNETAYSATSISASIFCPSNGFKRFHRHTPNGLKPTKGQGTEQRCRSWAIGFTHGRITASALLIAKNFSVVRRTRAPTTEQLVYQRVQITQTEFSSCTAAQMCPISPKPLDLRQVIP